MRIIVALIVLLLVSWHASVSARTLSEVRAAGELRVGVNPNFPPMSSYGADNRLGGFDVDVARRLAEKIGVRLVLVPTEAAQRVPFLVSGRIDLSMGALTITPERAALIDFTIPLHSEAMGVITTDRLRITRWQQLDRPEFILVNMRGNQSVTVLQEKLPQPRRVLADGNADNILALAQGRADALVENVDFFIGFTRQYPDVRWRILADPIFFSWCAVGVARGNPTLRRAIDAILFRLHKEGAISALWRKHYKAAMTVPITADQIEPAAHLRPLTQAERADSASYRFDWAAVLPKLPYLLGGAIISLEIAFIAFWGGLLAGLFGAIAKVYGGAAARRLVGGYVQLITNTPALVQIFLLYYALPDAGIMLGSFTAVVIGLTLNASGYLTEILRAGVVSLRRTELDAAAALGLSKIGILRHVMLPHIAQTTYKPLANFFIVLVLGSSMGALFGVEELTGRAINISTANLRTIETFTLVGIIYIGLTLIASAALATMGRLLFRSAQSGRSQ